MRRCSPAIFIGYKNEEDDTHTFYEYSGNSSVCYGLCHQLAFELQKDMVKEQLEQEE